MTKKQYLVFVAHLSCSDIRATISYCSIRNAYRTDTMRWPYNIQDRFPTFSTKIEMQGSRNNITRHTDRLGSWIVLICLYIYFLQKKKFLQNYLLKNRRVQMLSAAFVGSLHFLSAQKFNSKIRPECVKTRNGRTGKKWDFWRFFSYSSANCIYYHSIINSFIPQ